MNPHHKFAPADAAASVLPTEKPISGRSEECAARSPIHDRISNSRKGAALVIILSFIVLLMVVLMAYFSLSLLERQISKSSSNLALVANFADGAVNTVIGNLRQEISDPNCSVATNIVTGSLTSTIYYPKAGANAVPALAGSTGTNGLENLVKRSSSTNAFYPGGLTNAAASSTTNPSANGRYISAARWNKPLLIPPTATNDLTPVASAGFVPPDWIHVARDGSNPTTVSHDIIGRFAFTIYNEGGLLDANVAGYPAALENAAASPVRYKSALAFADLSQIGFTQAQIDALVGWRNHASAQALGDFSSYTFPDGGTLYGRSVLSNTNGFLITSNIDIPNGRTDRMFTSRQELISFLQNGLGLPATNQAFQCLTHFSRGINQPSSIPAAQTNASAPVVLAANLGGNSVAIAPYISGDGDKKINPSFPNTRVQSNFTRNDGTTAKPGDPLVNKRFALNRLAWITYKGPSASRAQGDADIQALITAGIPWAYLQLGTAANIQKYFGLTWDATKGRWKYNIHNGAGTGTGKIMLVGRPPSVPTADASTYIQDANRDPDFFELLKAGITVGSLGKAAFSSNTTVNNSAYAYTIPPGYSGAQVPANLRYSLDTSVDYHVIQIGANILSEVNPTSCPTRITFDDGSARGAWEFQGVTDLPYLSYIFNGVLRTEASIPAANYGITADSSPMQYPRLTANATVTNPGKAYIIQVPAVWNPYDPNGTQSVLRPTNFRVVIDSNDPIHLAAGGANERVWCAAQASTRPAGMGAAGGNQGLGTSPGAFSYDSTITNPTSSTGSPVSDSVTFTDTTGGSLFREPTLIFRTSYTGGSAQRTGGNISSIDNNPLPTGNAGLDPAGTFFAPLVLGSVPLAFQQGTNILYMGTAVIGHGLTTDTGNNRVYFTYRLQYQDPNNAGNWITYDTKYGRTTQGVFSYQSRGNFSPCVIKGPDRFNPYSWAAAMDPRTARFGLQTAIINYGRSNLYTSACPPDNNGANGWVYNSSGNPAIAQGITYPIRPDFSAGFYFFDADNGNTPPGGRRGGGNNSLLDGLWSQDVPFPSFTAGWTRPLIFTTEGHGPYDVYMFAPGMYAQNNPSTPFYLGRFSGDSPLSNPVSPSYYADADGVVRRASGAYVPAGTNTSASSPVGLPPAGIQGYPNKPASLVTPATKGAASDSTPLAQSQSRPLLLHRPFRTVAEMGYVFRDVPWKNLDFFTPESGDAALLDLFCINETSDPNGLVAGKVDLNTRQAPVLAAIVARAYVDDPKINNTTIGSLSNTMATNIGVALTARTADTNASYGPLQNVSELIGKWQSAAANLSGTTYFPIIAGVNCGIDLALPNYKDGKLSYVGFSGNTATTSGNDLSAVFSPATAGTVTESMAYVKRFREAPVRALASVGQTRVWNLMIDVVAQTGRYPQSANTLDKFVVEGEQRYWVHVAIDRLTGQVLAKQIEVIKE